MGLDDGFLRWSRVPTPRRAVSERRQDFREVGQPQEPSVTRLQAGRCMGCGVPFCHQGCPLGNDIPDFNEAVVQGRWREAYERLAVTNDFPELTGRLCPAPCEAACTLAINDEPVTIEQIELQIVERAFAEGWVQPSPPSLRTGRSVAVVGSGPAGLAVASRLNALGHTVVVLEADDRLGGLLRYGIPDFKLDKAVLDRRMAVLKAEGIRFRTGVRVGQSPRFDALAACHDAVVLAIGAGRPRDLPLPGRQLAGVHFAMTYLTAANRHQARGQPLPDELDARDKRVVILGGGDTGADCVGTALRQGAAEVTQVELLERPPEVRASTNPWPEWPRVFRTSSSHEEGGRRAFAIRTEAFVGSQGRVTGIAGSRVDTGDAVHVDADLVLLAVGFVSPVTERLVAQLGVELNERGCVATPDGYATSVPRVFVAGDARRGQSLIVWAIREGREAARAVDAVLTSAH
ncbi:MAG: glutamate synthase subunit beta [Myxococcales bacterium]|nr:glutamate synthase subunit beta [Myxococcales bacterium]